MKKTSFGKNLRASLLGVSMVALSFTAQGAPVIGTPTFAATTNYQTIDLNSSTAWTIYGGVDAGAYSGSVTDLTYGGVGTTGSLFSAINVTGGGAFVANIAQGGYIKYGYSDSTGGTYYVPPAPGNNVASSDTTAVKVETAGAAFNLTHIFQASTETLTFILANTGGGTNSIDLSATIGAATYSGISITPATSSADTFSVQFVVTGATIGDVFTLSLAKDIQDHSYDGVGISSARADFVAVPEPSTWALLGAGVIGLVVLRRRQKSVA